MHKADVAQVPKEYHHDAHYLLYTLDLSTPDHRERWLTTALYGTVCFISICFIPVNRPIVRMIFRPALDPVLSRRGGNGWPSLP